MQITLTPLTTAQKTLIASKVLDNRFIPHDPFVQQVHFLTNMEEEAFYGGQAGGGKSDALLMGALMYCDYLPDGYDEIHYDALILRRTLDDLEMPNAILDRAKQWILPYEDKGFVEYKDIKKKFTFWNGATLTFRYLAHNNDLNKYQGAELQFVGYDELTQFPENQYTYLHSRLRRTEDNFVPLRMRSASNPGNIGHDWVKNRFVKPDSPLAFVPSAYTDNPYLNHEEYSKQLDKLDEVTRQQLKYGNWDIIIKDGLLMNIDQFNNSKIPYNMFKDWNPVYCAVGIDPASTGTDKFSMACLCYFDNNMLGLVDLYSTPSSSPEEDLRDFLIRNRRYMPRVVNFEREAGSSSHYALQYWEDILSDLMVDMGFYVKDTTASSTGSKYNRAYPHAYHIRNGGMFVNADIRSYSVGGELYSPLDSLGRQYVYLHPDKAVMSEYPSPDECDSVGYAFSEVAGVVGGLGVSAP